MMLTWNQYLDHREARQAAATSDAPLVSGWTCEPPTTLHTCAPAGHLLFAALAPRQALPKRQFTASAFLHDRWLRTQDAGTLESTPSRRREWARYRLVCLGEQLQDHARAAWTRGWSEAPVRDAQMGEVWTHTASQRWEQRAVIEASLMPPALRAFRAVCLARRLPSSVTERASQGFREALFYRLLLPDQHGVSGWCELAARVLETAPTGPIQSLLDNLQPVQRRRAASCGVSRGSWRASAKRVLPQSTRVGRAQDLLSRMRHVEPLVDHHVQSRLLRAWKAGRCDGDWNIVMQARGRMRGRLRRLLAEQPDVLLQNVLAVSALHARTVDAVGRWAWAWAWDELARDFPFSLDRPLSPPCVQQDDLPEGLDRALGPALTCWLLLVIMKGRLPHLERWLADGGTGDRDTTWGRLLSEDLPRYLAVSRYESLRHLLDRTLADRLNELRELTQRLADLPAGRTLRARFESKLRPVWHPDVPIPKSGFPTFQRHIQAFLESKS